MSLNIYGDLLSQPTRSVLLFCKLNNIKYNFITINLGKGQQFSPDFKQINPLSKVPVIKLTHDGKDIIVKEGCTILRFLSEYYKVDNKWFSLDNLFRRTMINEWLDWHHLNSRHILANAVFRKAFLPAYKKMGVERDVPDTEKDIPKLLTYLDKQLSKRKFIVDDEISIADLIYSCELNQLELINYDFSPYPNVKDYIGRMNALQGMEELNQIIFKLKERLFQPPKPKF
jgi:glutathione S-transferase